jgi:20S proteasome alpha/beta subunit
MTLMHQLMLFMLTAAAAASSNGISSNYLSANSYESVRLLNEYGSAAQLDAARAACFQRGQCVVAIRNRRDGSIWIVSPRPDLIERPLNLRVGKSTTPFALDGGDVTIDDVTPLLQAVTSSPVASVLDSSRPYNDVNERQELSTPPTVYVVCSGVATDAAWLVQQLRLYGKHIADRYSGTSSDSSSSTTTTPASFARVVAALKRRFWSYPETTEYSPWTSVGYATLLQGYRDEQGRPTVWWGRPLGVCTMVLSVRPGTTAAAAVDPTVAAGAAHLELVEPSGVITTLNPHGSVNDDDDVQALGMGPDSAAAIDQLQALRDQYRPFDSDATMQEWIRAAFAAAIGSKLSLSPPLQVEIYTRGGTVMRHLWSDSLSNDASECKSTP